MSAPIAPTDALGSAAAIRLVAGREISARLGSKGFRLTTLAFVLAVIAGGVLLKLATDSDSAVKVGVTQSAAPATAQIEAAATGIGETVQMSTITDQSAAEQALRDGDLDVLVTAVTPQVTVVVKEQLNPQQQALFGTLAQQAALVSSVQALGGDPAKVTADLAAAAPQVTALQPRPPVDAGQMVAGYVAGILLFMSIMTAGQLVATGVVEEKSSRVVELLLSTLRPWQLMAGKVLGIGLIGLGQMVLIVGAGAATAWATGLLHGTNVNLGATAFWALLWFVVGFATYALLLAAMASLVSRQEDVGSVIGPVTTLMVIPYIIAISIAPWNPDNPLVLWLSRIPFCAPLIMPVRIALGQVGLAESLIALAISLAVIPLLVWFAARVYSNAVLRSGSRIRLRDALKES